jgi:hypothetical protein
VPDYLNDAAEVGDYQADGRGGDLQQCATSCSADTTTKFAYVIGQTYEYQYEADIKTSIPGNTEHSSLHIRAKALVDVISTCELVLRLSDVSLQDSDPAKYENRQYVDNARQFQQSLEKNPVRFGFIDGTIENICPVSNEEVWVLNIKRGILSTFQTTMATLQGVSETTEVDVSGNCPVKYEATSGWGSLKVKKTKNLLGCTERASVQTVFQSVGYEADSDIQTMPLMKGSHECNQEINTKSKQLTKSECTEMHVFRPFSRQGSGATTEIKYKIVFVQESRGSQRSSGPIQSRASLLYDHAMSDEEMSATLREAQATVTQLCRETETDVRPNAPALFATLVKQMRVLDTRNLRQLLSASKGICAKAEIFYRDALPVLGTAGSVSMIRELITSGQVTGPEAEILLTSIAFIKKPTTEMIKELQGLLTTDMERTALPISSVVNTYCKLNSAESPEVQAIIKTFEDELKYNCRIERDPSRILLALRALGNAGNADRVAPTLSRCAINEDAPMAIRVAAIMAFRRIPCSANREEVFRILENKQVDAELRIHAYLAVMQCADRTVISRVRQLLEAEEVNQVGSFIWTHLTNLAETSCPMKSEISDIIEDAHLLKMFDIDKRKFSRNIELSAYSEIYNIGGTVDSNIIFSSASYVPRSVNLNLTMNLFGQSLNLLEVGGRAQGMEQMLERYFGPGKEFEAAMKRDKRAVIRDEVISNIDRKFPKERDTTQLSYYLRVFGNEIRSGDIYNIDVEGVKNRFNFLDLFVQMAQDRNIDFTRNFAFLDTNLVVPTGVGMPLSLGVEGTVTVALKANGKIDIRKILSNPSNFDVTGSVRPSAALEIQAEFGVDAKVTRTRLRITNTLHTSTLLDGRLTLKDGQVFNADWNMPQQKMEIFSAESHFYISHRGQDREQTTVSPRSVQGKRCTDPTWSNKLGLELCGEISYPTLVTGGAMFPLSGPAFARVYINKLDTFTGARFEASVIRNPSDKVDTARFSFTTPGSRVDRELTADFKLDRANKDLSFNLRSPWKKVAITGQVVDQPALKRTVLKAIIDDRAEYSVTAELAIAEQRGADIKYTPSVKVVIPGRQPITLDGELTYTRGKKLMGKVAVRNALSEPITAEGSIELQDKRKSQKYDANIQFFSPILSGSFTGFVSSIQDNGNAWATRGDLNYQYKNGNKQRIVMNHKIRDTSTTNLKTYNVEGSWTTTMWPQYNGNYAIEEQYSPTSLRTMLDAGFDSQRKITIVQSGAFDVSGLDKKFNGMMKFELPYKNWNYEVKLDHIHNWDMLQSNGSVKYDGNKENTIDIGVRKENTKYLSVLGEATFKMAGRPAMTLTNTLKENTPREYHNTLSVTGHGRSVRAISVYKMGQRHDLSTDVQVTGLEPISFKGHLNPNVKNMQARAEVKYGQREYMADLSWLHRGTTTGFNTRAGAEIGYLNRNYGISGEVSRRNQDFSATVEAKVGQSQKISFSGQVTAIPTAPKADIRVEWPGNYVTISGTGKYETQGWMHTTNDLEASVKVTTSLRGFEEMGGLIKIDVSQDAFKSNGEVTWAPERKVTGDFSYDKTKATLNLATPFQGYRTIKADTSYQLKGRTLTTNSRIQWESNVIMLAGTSTNQRGNGYAMTSNGEYTLSTPWREYRRTKLTWRHQNDEGTTWTCHHELELDGGRKYVLDVDGSRKQVPGRSCAITVKSTLTTPIRNWEQVGLTWESNHEYRTIRSQGKGNINWGRNTIAIEHDLNIQPSTFVAKAIATTTFPGYEMMGVNLDNRLNTRNNTYALTNEVVLGDPRSKVNLDGTLSFNGPIINAGVRLTTPHPRFPRMVANFRNGRQEDGAWAVHGDLEYAPDKSFTMDGKLSMNRMYGLEVSVTSPLENLRTMSAKAVATVRSPKSFDVTAELSHNLLRDKLKFETTVEVETIRAARITASLQTPFREIQSAKISIAHAYETQEKCTTSATYEFNDYRGELNHEQTIRSRIEFDGKTKVMYKNGKTIMFNHRVSLNSRRSSITASLNTPFPEARSVDLNVNVEGPHDNFRATGEVLYNRRDKIDIGLDRTYAPDSGIIKSSLRITTPYEKLSRFVASIDRSGSSLINPGPNVKDLTIATIELNERRWYVKRDLSMENGMVKLNVKSETPYEYARTSEFNFEHTPRSGRNGNGWSNTASYELNGKKYNAESEYVWVGRQLRAKVVATVPEEYSLVLSHKGDRNEIKTELTAKAGPHGSGTSSFKWDNAGIDARASVETPYRGYEKFDATLKHEGPVSDFKTTVNLSTPFRDYRNFAAVLSYRGNPNDFTSSLQIDTPFRDIQRFTVAANHRSSNGIDSGASVEYNNKKIAATLTYKNEGRIARVTANVVTPFQGYETMSVDIDHTGDTWRTFRTNGRLTTSNNNLRQLTFGLDTSVANINDVRVSAEVGLPAGKVSAAYTHSRRGSGDVQCSLEVITPYRGYEKFSAAVDHQYGDGNPRTKITVTTPIRGYETFALSTEKSGTLQSLSLKGELSTSIRGWTRSAITWTHTITAENVELKGQLETSYPGYEKFALAVSHSSTRRGIKSLASVETSIRGYDRFAYNFDLATNRRNTRSSIAVETPFRNYDKFGGNVEYSTADNEGFRASAQLTTPIEGYKTFGASINHAGPASQFETTGTINTPFRSIPQIDYTIRHRGYSFSDFSTYAGVEYGAGKKVNVELTYKMGSPSRYEVNYEGSFKFNNPSCPYVQSLTLTASHNRKPTQKAGGMEVTFNGEKKLDFDYSYATGGDSNIVITMRDPYPMATNLNMADSAGSADVNWDTTDQNKKVRFDFALKNVVTSSSTERLLSFKTLLPKRIVGFSWGYSLTPDKFTNNGELYWTANSLPDFTYEIQGTKSDRRNMLSYDGNFKISSALVNFDSSLSHKSQPGRKHVTEIGLQTSDKLTIRNDLTFNGNSDFTHTLTAQHPRFTRDVSLVTETKNGNSFTTTLNYERQSATLEGRLVDESRSGYSARYTGSLRFAHPNSLTDVQLSGEAYSDAEKLGANLKGQYQTTRDRQMQTAELRSEINRIRREITAELTTPLDTLKLSAKNRELNDEAGVYRYDIAASTSRSRYRSTIDISAKDRSGDIKLFNAQDDYLEIFAQVFSPTQASFEISRVSQGQKISDVAASLSMSDDRMVTGRAYLRPEFVRDVRGYYQNIQREPLMPREFGAAIERVRRVAQDEIQLKGRSANDAVAPMQETLRAISDAYNNKVNEIQNAFDMAYRGNEFYMRDIHQALRRHYDDLSRRVQYKMVELRRYWDNNVVPQIQQSNAIIAQKFKEYCDWMEYQTREIRNEIKARAQTINQYFDNVSRNIAMKHRENMENLYRQPWFQRMSPAQLMEYLRMNYEEFMGKLTVILDKTADRPELRQFRETVLRFIEENKWMYEFLGLEPQVTRFVQTARAMTWQALKAKAQQSVGEFFKLDKNRWTVWDPQRGEFVFQVYMPIDLPDVSLIQRLDPTKYIAYSNDLLSRYLPDEDWSVMDTIYRYKPKADVADWVPPFKAHASLTGSQHFMTFDKKFFSYAGECSYLLARDFIDKTFSVAVNYEKPARGQPIKKSITVMCEGKQIEIYPDAKITLDGSRVEMPLRVGNATVSRQGSSISVKNDLGLDITCDLPHDHCTVAVSGWYYGKTAGLMGTYDNEKFNDYTTIDKTIADRPETMAEGWSMGTRCRSTNRVTPGPLDVNTRRYRKCATYFSDATSPFRSCFRRVDPEPFLKMCVDDVSVNDNSLEAQDDVCRTAAAYMHECRRNEVHLRMPSECVKCEVPISADKFYEGETKTLNSGEVPKTADIVFVVQHSQCNKDVVDKLKGVVDDMEKALRAEGLKNSQYAVVGFGGQEHLSLAHVHTMDGQLFNAANKVAATFNGFSVDSGTSPDALSAIAVAARLPFRAGASKTIILIPCDSCKEQTIRYSDVQRVLLQSDIRLHVLIQDPILLKSRSPKTAFIFGVDETTVYTSKDTSDDLAGEEDLRKYIRMPKDLCVALTQDTYGAVFSARQWLDSRTLVQKKFSDIMVRAIARKAAPTECQVCECVADQNGNGMSQCQSCTPRNPIYSMMPNFYSDDYSDNEVAEVSRPVGQVPQIDSGDTWITAAPVRTTARPKKGDRVTRKPRVTKGPKKVAPPKQQVPAKPKVKDQ